MPLWSPRRGLYRGLRALSRWQWFVEQRMTPLGRFTLATGVAAGVFGIDPRMNLLYQAFALAAALLLVGGLGALAIQWRLRGRLRGIRDLPRHASVGLPLRYPVRLTVADDRRIRGGALAERLPDPRPSLARFVNARLPEEGRANRFDRALGYPRWRQLIRLQAWTEGYPPPQPLTAPVEQGQVYQQLPLQPRRRGYLRLTAMLFSRPDPLGLFRAQVALPCAQTLLVLPRRYPVPRLTLPGRRQYQPGGLTLASHVGDSQEFIGLREYRPGDSPRTLHWPSWARSGKPQVKEYQDEFFTRHALILDSFAPDSLDPRFEAAISTAASLAEAIQDGENLLDLLFVGAQAYCFTSGRGLAGIEQFLEVLACAQACTDHSFFTLEQSVRQRAGRLSAAVCILLDFDSPRRDLVRHLTALGLPLKVLVLAYAGETEKFLAGWEGPPPRLLRPDRLEEDLAHLA